MTDESREIRLKRLRIRSWRRGTREMDLLLGPYSDGPLAELDEPALAAYEALLEVGDTDLYAWISGAKPAQPEHAPALARIRDWHGIAA
jgi:antitoxin CptB